MNRYTREHLQGIVEDPSQRWWIAAWAMMAASEHPHFKYSPIKPTYKAVLELLLKKAAELKRQPDPRPLAKYILRVFGAHEHASARSLAAADPYATVSFWRFSGKFAYTPAQGGFVPYGATVKISQFLRDYYENVQHDRMLDAWNRLRPALLSEGGGKPILVYKFEAPHVYFMKRGDSGQVKIGVSIHPGTRRKQLMAQFGVAIDLLHVVPSAGYEEEGRLHQQFAALRTCGEWFRPESELLTYITQLQAAPPPAPKPTT